MSSIFYLGNNLTLIEIFVYYAYSNELDLILSHTMERSGAARTLSQCSGFNFGREEPSLLPGVVSRIGHGGGGGGPELDPFRFVTDMNGGGRVGGGGGGVGAPVPRSGSGGVRGSLSLVEIEVLGDVFDSFGVPFGVDIKSKFEGNGVVSFFGVEFTEP